MNHVTIALSLADYVTVGVLLHEEIRRSIKTLFLHHLHCHPLINDHKHYMHAMLMPLFEALWCLLKNIAWVIVKPFIGAVVCQAARPDASTKPLGF